jgi:hypothetical protein
MKMRVAILIATTTVLITACATGARKTVEFSAASPQALLIFGTISEPRQRYSIVFSTYDAANLRLASNSFKGQYFVDHMPATSTEVQYHALLVPPGTYVVKNVTVKDPGQQTDICLSKGTPRFELNPGSIVYVGNIALREGHVVRVGFDDAAAAAALKDYPNVHGELVRGTLTNVTFRNGKDLFGAGEVCGGYYVDELPKS